MEWILKSEQGVSFRDFRDKIGGMRVQVAVFNLQMEDNVCLFLFRTEKVKVFEIRNDIFRIGKKVQSSSDEQ